MAPAEIEGAVRVLEAGGLVGLPTETVYGLAADASNGLAVRRIFAAKGRPSSHPLITHVADVAQAQRLALHWPEKAEVLAQALWPGPLTLIVPRGPQVIDEVTGGQPTVAIRVPAHPVALDVLRAFGRGVAAPSANRFGAVSPTTAQHVRDSLGTVVDVVLDGGPCTVGVESTIVDVSGVAPRVLRPGSVSVEQLEALLGEEVEVAGLGETQVRAPGLLASHYAPSAGLVVVTVEQTKGALAAQVALGEKVVLLAPMAFAGPHRWLPVPDDAEGFARVLYARLREADEMGADLIVAVAPTAAGVGLAVIDRLAKAAHPVRLR